VVEFLITRRDLGGMCLDRKEDKRSLPCSRKIRRQKKIDGNNTPEKLDEQLGRGRKAMVL